MSGANLTINVNVPANIYQAIENGTAVWKIEIGTPTINGQPQPVVRRPPPVVDQVVAPKVRRVQDTATTRSFGTIQQHFYSLQQSGRMLQQTDWRLAQRELLIPNGGLCATTSAVNVLHAAFSHLGRDTSVFTSKSPDIVARMVSQAWQRLGKDARVGLDFSSLSTVIDDVANQLHPEVGVKADRPYNWRTSSGVNWDELKGDNDTLALLCVTTGADSAHAITLLNVDRYRGVVIYSDPNHPNQALEAPYTESGGRLYISSFAPGEVTDVLKIRTKNFDKSGAIRWRDFEGKRVHITGTDGRKWLTTIDRIDFPSAEYPNGRVVAFSYVFGSGGGGTTEMDQIRAIEEVKAPAKGLIDAYQKYAGKKVRIKFSDPAWAREHSDKTFLVESISRESNKSHHIFGGLKVKRLDDEFSSGVVPYEVIDSIELATKTRKIV